MTSAIIMTVGASFGRAYVNLGAQKGILSAPQALLEPQSAPGMPKWAPDAEYAVFPREKQLLG